MTRLLMIFGLIFLIIGCAAHYSRVKDDTLELVLEKRDTQEVYLACSLDGFQPQRARNENNRWVVSLPLTSQFSYYYIVDGKVYLPACDMKEDDDFGSQNCIFDPDL